ncbi:MAG: hypothetical protein ACP5LP_01050 [Candidatus Micrarchaeia archaeon]
MPGYITSYYPTNITNITLCGQLFSKQVPNSIYIVNPTSLSYRYNLNEFNSFVSDLKADLSKYNINDKVSVIPISNISYVNNNSIVVLPTGLFPLYLLQNNSAILTQLFSRGITIIYIGGNFSYTVGSGAGSGAVIPISSLNISLPSFMSYTEATNVNGTYYLANDKSPLPELPPQPVILNLKKPMYLLRYGTVYENSSFISQIYGEGSLLVLPYYPDMFSSADLSSNLANSIFSMFWMPTYAYGCNNLTGQKLNNNLNYINLLLFNSNMKVSSYNNIAAFADNPSNFYGRIYAIYTNNSRNYSYESFNFSNINFKISGLANVNPIFYTNSYSMFNFTIFTGSQTPIVLPLHINIFNVNMTNNMVVLPETLQSAKGNFSFIVRYYASLPPGDYVAQLANSRNNVSAMALFAVPPISINLISSNYSESYSKGNFTFQITENKVPIPNLPCNVSINGRLYHQNLTTNYSGMFDYVLPKDAVIPSKQNLVFTINIYNSNYTYAYPKTPAISFTINPMYTETAIVSLVVIILLVFVKDPYRDEFYIDYVNLPSPQKIKIKIKPDDIIALFDKMNNYYHWNYMPLSKIDIRNAINSNIKYNGMPIGVTYQNVDKILDDLVVAGYLVKKEDFYIPAEWVKKSGYDITYLATFKKLRLYFMSHAYVFTDLGESSVADIIVNTKIGKIYIQIYSTSSKFKNIISHDDGDTYLTFFNQEEMDDFMDIVYSTSSSEAEKFRVYLSSGKVKLLNADNIQYIL